MKRGSILAGLVSLVLIFGSASTWEGSAVVGGSADIPDDGLYGACNSFPKNTSVVVTNLETGTSITVLITENVDNPAVFMALSPKAAAQLGMHAGAASRVRAVASLGSPSASLPATRTGETSDPDFNPRVFMERDSAAQAAAEGKTPGGQASAAQPASAQPSVQPATPSAAQLIEEAAASTAPASSTPGAAAPATAAAVAPTPSSPATAPAAATEPQAAAAAVKPAVQATTEEQGPTAEAMPQASPSPAVAATAPLVEPAAPQAQPPATEPAATEPAAVATGPELDGGSRPQPRAPAAVHVALSEPEPPENGTVAAAPESASVIDLARPAAPQAAPSVALVDPELGPDILPDEALPRMAAPSAAQPDSHLAEIDLSNLKFTDTTPESIALERPAPSAAASPSELGEPQSPTPQAIAKAEAKPAAVGEAAPAKLEEPPAAVAVAPAATPPATAAQTSSAPQAPVGKPGEVIVGLEPAAPRPPASGGARAAAAPQTVPPATPQATGAVSPPKPAAPAQVPATAVPIQGLAKGSFYVQLGVYGTNDALQAAVRGFSAYPLAVEKISGKNGATLYRLYVGPLSRDESGVVLIRIRSLGFKDAFLRAGT